MIKKIIIVSVVISFLLSGFSFAQGINQVPKMPGTLEGASTIGLNALKQGWQEALRTWGRMADIFFNLWKTYILPWTKSLWQKIKTPFIKEIEKRKPIIEEEFKKEEKEIKEEIKVEASRAGKSLWQRFKELFK